MSCRSRAWAALAAFAAFIASASAQDLNITVQVCDAFGVCTSAPIVAQNPGSFMPVVNDVSANWSKAGLLSIGGIPNRSTQCGATVNAVGAAPTDANNINAAITACDPTGGDKFVLLGTGQFVITQSQAILLNKAITLRGTGNGTNGSSPYFQTEITVSDGAIADWTISPITAGTKCGINAGSAAACTAATGVILVSPSANFDWGWSNCPAAATSTNPTTSNCGTTLAADVAQGATTVQVASTTNFSVGGWVLIDEDPRLATVANPACGANATCIANGLTASSEFLNTSASPAVMRVATPDTCGGGFCPYTFVGSTFGGSSYGRVNQEIHKISAIGAGPCPGVNCTLTFDSPLTLAFRQSGSHDARVYWSTKQTSTPTPFLEQAGVENMTISRAGNGGIDFEFCAYCWAKNVEVRNWIAGAVNFTFTVRNQLEFSYLHDCFDCENNGEEYPIGVNSASTENLIVNNIIRQGGKGMVGRAAPVNVVAYNYIDSTFYMNATTGNYWMDMSANGSHYGGTHHFLFEGNWADNCDGDETHGNAVYHTFFRNHCTATRTAFTDPSQGQTEDDANGIGWGQASSFTGSIAATTLNVSAGAVTVGSLIQGVGVAANTKITASLGGGNYTVSVSQTVGSETLYTTPTASPGPLRAAGPMAFNYWYSFVGNVLGLFGVTTSGNGWTYQGANCGGGSCSPATTNKNIWMSGWVGGEWPSTDTNLNITASGPFIYKHGNYDYVNAAIVDWAPSYPHNLPNSFYLTAAPSFFGPGVSNTYTWPWVDSTATPPIKTNSGGGSGNPAKARRDAGTPFAQP